MNIIWHLFADEVHQVVNITVTHCPVPTPAGVGATEGGQCLEAALKGALRAGENITYINPPVVYIFSSPIPTAREKSGK